MKIKSCERCVHWQYCDYKENYYYFYNVCGEYKENNNAMIDDQLSLEKKQ